MKKKEKREKKDYSWCIFFYFVAIVVNILLHVFLFFRHRLYGINILHFVVSFVAFMYAFCYIVDFLYSFFPSTLKLLRGKKEVNLPYYMNIYQKYVKKSELAKVTISIPVYLEDNNIIFQTLRDSLDAKNYYRHQRGQANIVVSDDGIGILLQGMCDTKTINRMVRKYKRAPDSFSDETRKALERIVFYRENKIGFVVRPKTRRPGLFKKASNLNYTLRLGEALKTKSLWRLTKPGSGEKFEGGYAEGDISTHEIILLLDKDSGVNKKIIKAIVPEFAHDDKLAYVQCSTEAKNIKENYFARLTGRQTNDLFHNVWPCQALKKFFVPLVGHNVFIRKSALEMIHLWSEHKVSEDFDAAIKFYARGYHGKYAQLEELNFSEYTSRTFIEETNKQYRYTYGLFEMMFSGTVQFKKTRKRDFFFLVLYILSKSTNMFMIPYTLFLAYLGEVDIMCYGYILCRLVFVLLPPLRKLIVRRKINRAYYFSLVESLFSALIHVGHSFAVFSGALRYLLRKIIKNRTVFAASPVDSIEYSFRKAMYLARQFVSQNKGFFIIYVLCLERIVYVLVFSNTTLFVKIVSAYILGGTILAPFICTPLFYRTGAKDELSQSEITLLVSVMLYERERQGA